MEAETEPLSYILNYYRERIENNEDERRKWYETLGKLRISQDYDHRLRWEHKKRTEELQELETAVKDAHYFLYDYRDKIGKLKDENNALVQSETENRRTIKDLLALNNSVEQHVHFSEGSSPERLLSYSKSALGNNIHQRNKENIPGSINLANQTPKTNPNYKTPNIIRTVYLENSDLAALRKELEELQTEIHEEKDMYECQLHAARNEKAEYDEYARQELISDNAKINDLLQEFEQTDHLSLDTLMDYGRLLQEADDKVRTAEEQNEKLRIENTELAAKIKKVKKECENELRNAEEEYERQTQQYAEGMLDIDPNQPSAARFKQQSDIQSEYIEIIKDQYNKIQDIYRKKSKILVKRQKKMKEKLAKTEARRALEMSGYYEDLRLLDKKCNLFHKS
ncbi:unnamed protein product [Moneuplotes crassus]|uniref:Uncharacterized protein n=1 Tax=Euplotes crassus TaxID=5936 RepID=A0AAD1XFV8_EUPCR|nr:unnamed protein product [Moneuplotes crassus]